MTDLIPWLLANWPALAIGLAFLILLIVMISGLLTWYFWRWIIELGREPEPLPDYAFGDVPHMPKEARRDAA